MILSKVNRNILREVAAENNVSFNEAVEAVFAQFSFVYKVISEGDVNDYNTFKAVRLLRFGSFVPHVNKIALTRKKKREYAKHN